MPKTQQNSLSNLYGKHQKYFEIMSIYHVLGGRMVVSSWVLFT